MNKKKITVIIFLTVIILVVFLYSYEKKQGVTYQKYPGATNSNAYSISPLNRDAVHDYVRELIITEQYEKAYGIIKKYFDETPKENYWEDVDIWQERGLASLKTHRCTEAGVSGWHVINRTKEGEKDNEIAGEIMHYALNDKECIDQETFIKDMKDDK